jgi:hypothetical protein
MVIGIRAASGRVRVRGRRGVRVVVKAPPLSHVRLHPLEGAKARVPDPASAGAQLLAVYALVPALHS